MLTVVNWGQVDPSSMLELTQLSAVYYTNEPFDLTCNASYYYFSGGLIFTLTSTSNNSKGHDNVTLKATESTITQQTTGKNGVLTDMEYLHSLQITGFSIKVPGTYKLICVAPVWNTTEWVTKGVSLLIVSKGNTDKICIWNIIVLKTAPLELESEAPTMEGGVETEWLSHSEGVAGNLTCTATAVPPPTFTWTFNSLPVPVGMTVFNEHNGSHAHTALLFPDQGTFGNFTCTAWNYGGHVSKTFSVVPPSSSTKHNT